MPLLQANKNSTWPSQHCWNLITLQWCKYTNMVIVHCTLNKQTWMIPHFDQRVTADAKMYHTWLYVKCTIIYDHVCTQFWRSVSASGHGNRVSNKLPRPTRVRIRPLSKDEMDSPFQVWYCLHLKMSLEVKYPTCQSNWYLLCWPLKCLFKSEGFFLEMTLIQMNPFMNHLTRTSTVESPLEVVKQFWLCANFLT